MRRRSGRKTSLKGVCALLVSMIGVALAASLVAAASASALASSDDPGWAVSSRAYPTYLPPGGSGVVVINLLNTGAGASSGNVTVTDTLPPGLTATSAGALQTFGNIDEKETESSEVRIEEEEEKGGSVIGGGLEQRTWSCTAGKVVTCTTRPGAPSPSRPELGPVLRPIVPGSDLRLGILVKAASGHEGTVVNHVTASGGGALGPGEVSNPLTISSGTPGFGFAGFDDWFSNANGTADTQAGSHPYQATFSFDLNQAGATSAGGSLRNLSVELPPGLVGDTNAVSQCTRQQLLSSLLGGCPASTQVGVDSPALPEGGGAPFTPEVPVYNMVPPPGVPVEFGFTAEGVNVLLDAQVRSGSDYGVTEDVRDLGFAPVGNTLTVWGIPGEKVHDRQRCGFIPGVFVVGEGGQVCGLSLNGTGVRPFLTVPTSCEGSLTSTIHADTWQNANVTAETSFASHDLTDTPAGYSGCEHLGFVPSLSVAPDTTFADTPAGLSVNVKVPQEGLVNPEGLAAANIKDTTVTLPEGVAINPGQAAGLAACQMGESGIGTDGPASCPNASKVGTDEIETPLLRDKLEGSVYVLQSNPPNLKLLVAASGDGVYLKLIGDVHLDEATGRLTTTFENTPELPFTDFKLSFSGGAQAALTTPTGCGTYSTVSDFTPWTAPVGESVFPSSSFLIERGTGGGACPPSPLPFSPSMIAGATTDQAGGYTDFSLLLSRADDQQRVGTLQFKTPKGLLGMISKVPLCAEAEANAGTCPAASQIGHTVVEAGPGPYPLVVPQPGQPPAPIYLTGGYKGAPYGLSIVVPLVVGPFTLQTQVVRARIEVDPLTTQLTITTDPLPTIIDGIPADLRTIDAVIDRAGFMFNPTNCSPQAFSGTATSAQGAQAAISSHFQVGSCQSLKFAPDFKVSTSGKATKAGGASLDAKIVYPTGPLGANQASQQSNIASVKVDLPKQLPSRLTTLQKACTAAQFDSNPAGCPKESMVGKATAITPVLPVPLTGPAYFVSHGGEAFPQLIVVLQGYGVTVDLVGDTFISKAGITSSTFKQVPDVPITSFDLSLPEGKFSALAANLPEKDHGDFCGQKLTMPTAFTAQNGAVINQSTPIAVEGCSTALSFTHKVKQKTLTLTVYAPVAGKITATGKGITSQTKTAKGQENLTITLKQKRAGKQKTTVKVAFTPSTGKDRKKQGKSAKITFKK
jgi:hypothetical protein